MRVLVWQWGRRGGGPRYGVELAESLRALPDDTAVLSLSRQAELLRDPPPLGGAALVCEVPVATYDGLASFLGRIALAPLQVRGLAERLRSLRLDVAICAMPGPLDLLMAAALRRIGVPFLVVVHDADLHPGDGLPFQMLLQRSLMRRASGLIALSRHVQARLLADRPVNTRGAALPVLLSSHPPRSFGSAPPPAMAHPGPVRLLSFGRLLPYKGLDLLVDALRQMGPRGDFTLRVVGQGPESAELAALRGLPGVSVENRWVPEAEIAELLAWADALVLSHREASQSGGAAAAIAARRWVVSTRVGGLAEQLHGEPLARLCDPTAASLAAALAGLLDERPAAAPPPDQSPEAAWHDMARALVAELRDKVLK